MSERPPGSLDEQDTRREDLGGTVPVPSGTDALSATRCPHGHWNKNAGYRCWLPMGHSGPHKLQQTHPTEPGTGDSQEVVSRVSSGGSSVTREAREWLRHFVDFATGWGVSSTNGQYAAALIAERESLEAALVAVTADRDAAVRLAREISDALDRLVAALVAATARADEWEEVASQRMDRLNAAATKLAWYERVAAGGSPEAVLALQWLQNVRDDAPTQSTTRKRAAAVIARLAAAEARAVELETALTECDGAITPLLGTINYYIGPGARTAVSRESVDKYRRLVAARDAARSVLARDGNPGLGGAGGASSTGTETPT